MKANETNTLKSAVPGGLRIAVGLLFVAMVSHASAEKLDVSGPITNAIGNEPPYTELKPDGTLSGAGPDIDRAALKESGVTQFTGQTMPYGAMIPALQAGRVRMVSSGALVIRPERCQAVIFSEPVICNSDAFLVRGDLANKLHSYKDIAAQSLKVAAPAGSVQEKSALAAGVKRENVIAYPDGTSAVKMLKDKRIDAIVLNDSGVKELQKRANDPDLKMVLQISDAPVNCAAAAFKKSDTALRDAYNAGLKKVVSSGEYKKIMDSYGLEDNAKLLASAKPAAEQCRQ